MTSELKLLESFETFSFDRQSLKESLEKSGKIVLKGVIQRADSLNHNGRVYPRHILEREIRNYQKFINERRSTGELDHPEESVVRLEHVSHVITKAVFREGSNDVYGEIELLNTPRGKIAQQLVADEITLGISSRGVGSVKQEGNVNVVQEDFQLICWDLVSEPSTPGAFIRESRMRSVSPDALKSMLNRGDRIFRATNDVITQLSRCR